MTDWIPLCEPNIGELENQLVLDALGQNEIAQGKYVAEFEELVAEATGREWCVAVSSGTAALHLALKVWGLKPGMPVDMPSYTYAATAAAAKYLGAEITFVDVNEYLVAKCDLAVETFGNPATGEIVDAACSIGRGKIGGLMACLSFNGNKTITTGGGGAVIGDDWEMEDEVRHLSRHAKTDPYTHDEVGFNYVMPNINAALGVAQMARLKDFVAIKRRIAKTYEMALGGGLPYSEGSARWMSGYTSDEPEINITAFRSRNIDARRFWEPLHLQKPYEDCAREALPKTEAIWDKIICLPCSTNLTDAQQSRVIDAVLSLRQGGRTPAR